MNLILWTSLLLLPWQLTPPDPVVSMLPQVVAEVEARYQNEITLRLDSRPWASDKQSTKEQVRQLTAAAETSGRELLDVRKVLACPEERSSYEDCTLPDGLWVLQVSRLAVNGEQAEMWFRLLFQSDDGGVRSPGFQARFTRGTPPDGDWKLRDITLRIMP